MLTKLSPTAQRHLGLKTCRWQQGTKVTVRLSGQYLHVGSPYQEFIWEGEHSLVDFDVTVVPDAPIGVTVLKYDVAIDGIVVAKLRLDLEISPKPASQHPNTDTIEPARSAFASYASQDRLRVLDRVAAVRISADVDVFLDCLSLNPGDAMKPRLQKEIRDRDLFLLFWSSHAKDSPWVSWEWHTALQEKGESAIQLHPLQAVAEAPPPDELKHLHFGDVYMLVRKAEGEAGAHAPK